MPAALTPSRVDQGNLCRNRRFYGVELLHRQVISQHSSPTKTALYLRKKRQQELLQQDKNMAFLYRVIPFSQTKMTYMPK